MGARKLYRRVVLAGIAALAAGALAAPAARADVDTFTVDSFVDAGDISIGNNACATGGAVCTLRAAVQETNDTDAATDTDVINFAAPIVGTTIQLGAVMDTIDEPLSINGCSTAPNNPAPCVGVRGLNTSTDALFLNGATDVTVRGLAFSNMDRGIAALSGTEDLTVKNNWFGIRVDGTDEAIRTGVQVTADGAVIGGTAGATGASPADRNVFANATVGEAVALDIFVGDDAVVQGNWFGTNETGTAAAANGEDITLGGNVGGDAATNTTIGGTQASPGTCAGACNVISGATTDGIDLMGLHPDEAADTTITGNFIGLNASGTAGIPNATSGIRTVNAPGTTIGGSAGQGNYIAGGDIGISALFQGAPGLEITGNRIGTNTDGTAPLSPPEDMGMLVMSDATDPTEITLNTIATAAGGVDAIQILGDGALIGGNFLGVGAGGQALGAGSEGIRTVSLQDSIITGNTIGNFTLHGLTLEGSDGNTVVDNRIGTDGSSGDHGNGADGIRIAAFSADPATGNTIGGTLLAQQNVISNNDGDGIGILGDGNDGNAIRRNTGAPNGTDPGDLFIDLVGADGDGNGATGPNGGIDPPDLQAASAARSVGLGPPGATVAAFAHTDFESSSLGGFAGLAVPDSRGLWVITHTTPPPGGQGLAHTQSTAGGTSELSIVGSGFIDPPDAAAPGAAIAAGPSGLTAETTPSFTLDDPNADPNFQIFLCATDAGLYEACGIDGSVYTTAALSEGPHSVTVLGVDEAANLSAPLTHSFTVDSLAPSTTVTKAPKKKISSSKKKVKVTFTFASSEPGQGGFQCQLDNAAFEPCDAGSFTRKTKRGKHTFRVRAFDAVANTDPTLEVRSFTIKKKKAKKR